MGPRTSGHRAGEAGKTGRRYQKLNSDKSCELSLEFGIYSKDNSEALERFCAEK